MYQYQELTPLLTPLWKLFQLHPQSLPYRRRIAVDVLRLPLTNDRVA